MLIMKTLYESLLDDFENVESSTDYKEQVIQFLKDNYSNPNKFKVSNQPNKDGYYEVDCSEVNFNVVVTNKNITSLTNDLFVFVNVKGTFECVYCKKLTSLKGAPKKVGRGFNCSYCDKLTSLEGAPKEVGVDFNCFDCNNLISLKGAPKKVGEDFNCFNCDNLTSLKGAPKKVGRDFNCFKCK